MLVGLIDLGINNLTSVQRAFSDTLKESDTLQVFNTGIGMPKPDLIILPGLGKFGTGMAALRERLLIDPIKKWNEEGSKVVGICLGMQLLGTESAESVGEVGLDLIPSRIERLASVHGEKIPHTGWAEVNLSDESQPFTSLTSSGDYYFVHSYHLIPEIENDVLTRTPFGKSNFVSSVLRSNILGVQFHPEKSGKKGKRLVAEILNWANNEK